MVKFKVNEKFVSIDGEGPTSGALSVFLRFAGCNLNCSWCDTAYAHGATDYTELLTVDELVDYVKSTGINHVTLTGGEPLLQKGIDSLLGKLSDYQVHVETNGSVDVKPFRVGRNVHFVLDYKLPDSGMENLMYLPNFEHVEAEDAVKFVSASQSDLQRALEIIREYWLCEKTQVYISCVFGKLQGAEVVDFLIRHKLQNVKLQLQIHKYTGVR